jgi:hypothetical protein
VFRTVSSFVLACLLPVILAAGSCLACFSIVTPNPASMCCKHGNPCQDKASHSDCLDQAAGPGQAGPAGSIAVASGAPVSAESVIEPVIAPILRVSRQFIPAAGEASPPGLFVLHSALLI